MRHVVFGLLVAILVALCGWVAWRGHAGPPPERLALEEVAAGNPSEEPSAAGATARQPPTKTASAASVPPEVAIQALFASPLAEAAITGEVTLYDPSRLYDYIDGAAPMYLERKFRVLAAAEMTFPNGGGELTCDVYDMTDGEHAKSIAGAERSAAAKAVPSWPEAFFGPMSFVFSKGHYYVKLTAFDPGAEARLPALARALAERMR